MKLWTFSETESSSKYPGIRRTNFPRCWSIPLPKVKRLERVVGMANDLIDAEGMLPLPAIENPGWEPDAERRKMDLAINLADQYLRFVTEWQWGDSILEWIRQCEITFGTRLGTTQSSESRRMAARRTCQLCLAARRQSGTE